MTALPEKEVPFPESLSEVAYIVRMKNSDMSNADIAKAIEPFVMEQTRVMSEGIEKLYLAPAMIIAYGTIAAVRLSPEILVISPVLAMARDRLVSQGLATLVDPKDLWAK